MNEKDTRQNMKVASEDYKKIQAFMAENSYNSNVEFMHFIAENLSRIGATAPTDGNDEVNHVNPVNPVNPVNRQGSEVSAESTSLDGIAGIDTNDGSFVHGKFYPTLFPNESWDPEDRKYYWKWVENNLSRGLRFDLQEDFNGMRKWKTDHEGNPKEKTPYGYFTDKYLMWHTWPIYPELWPNVPKQKLLFPECQEPEYMEGLRRRHSDPFYKQHLLHPGSEV